MTIREFLGLKVSCENIKIVNDKKIGEVLWQAKYETIDNQMPDCIADSEIVKWSVKDDGIILWINL